MLRVVEPAKAATTPRRSERPPHNLPLALSNEDSNLDVAEKEKLSKAAKKLIEEKKNGALLTPSDGGER